MICPLGSTSQACGIPVDLYGFSFLLAIAIVYLIPFDSMKGLIFALGSSVTPMIVSPCFPNFSSSSFR
jgi:hypothetical protein